MGSFDGEIEALCTGLRWDRLSQMCFIERCIALACCSLECSRAALWIFVGSPGGRTMRCVRMYDRASGLRERMHHSSVEGADEIYEMLCATGQVIADDAQNHPATRALFQEERTRARAVRALIATPFSTNGELFGAFVCTQLEEAPAWNARQLFLLRRISVRATSAIASVAPRAIAQVSQNW